MSERLGLDRSRIRHSGPNGRVPASSGDYRFPPPPGQFDRRIRVSAEPGSGGRLSCPTRYAPGDRAAPVFVEHEHVKIDRSPNERLAFAGDGYLRDLEFVDLEAEPPPT